MIVYFAMTMPPSARVALQGVRLRIVERQRSAALTR